MSFAAFQRIKKLFKQTTTFSLLISVSVYSWARILFFEVPFTLAEDLPILAKIILLCWIIALATGVAFNILVKIGEWLQQTAASSYYRKWILTLLAVLSISVLSFLF